MTIMTRSGPPSPVASISKTIRIKENIDNVNAMHQTVASTTLPTTDMTMATKVPHTRRVTKSKTCNSFLTHNQQQQQGDIELATAIGQDLLLEVKKMQGLLHEKTNSLAAMALEKADAQQEIDQLTIQLKQRSDTLECRKEQIWTLELEKQEQAQIINDLQQKMKRLLAEQTKKDDQGNNLKQELEHLKQQQVTWQEAETQSKQDRLDLAITRRRLAALQRQVSSNKAMVDASRVSYAGGFLPSSHHATNDTYRFSLPSDPQLNLSHLTPPNVSSSASYPASIAKSVRQQQQQQQDEMITMNAELRASLTTANDTIQALQHSVDNERKKRVEMETLWREAQEVIENEQVDNNSSITTTCTTDSSLQPESPLDSQPPGYADADSSTHKPNTTDHNESFGISPPVRPCRRVINKEAREKRQKCLSLGDELSLAGPGGELPCFSVYVGENMGAIVPKATKQWCSKTLEPYTNLDDTDAINRNNNAESGLKQEECGSLLRTQCYVYDSITSDSRSSHQDQQTIGTLDKPSGDKDVNTCATGDNDTNRTCQNLLFDNDDLKKNSDSTRYVRALTRTMIGDWMWKYTRKLAGKGISENKHKRFFWLHPYSRTLYWSTQGPDIEGYRYNTKSAMIESFMVIDDGRKTSFYIQTSHRNLKIQCTDDSTHQEWLKSLKYLLIDVPATLSSTSDQSVKKEENEKQVQMNYRRLNKLIMYHPPHMTHKKPCVAGLRSDHQHAYGTITSVSSNYASRPLESTLSALAPNSFVSLPSSKGM